VNKLIQDMALAIVWISDLTDMKLIKRELTLGGFDPDDVEMYADCAVSVANMRRILDAGHNQLVDERSDENQ
jgi:hypothetical protein